MPNAPLLALLAAAGLLIIVFSAQLATGFGLLLRLRFRDAGWRPVARDAVPDDIRLILDTASPGLDALGFGYLDSAIIHSPQATGDPDPIYIDYYQHRDRPVFASVHPAEQPEPGALAAVAFDTLFDDGATLTTVNRRSHLMLPMPDGIALEDADCADLTGQWDHHRRQVAAHETPASSDPRELRRRQGLTYATLVDHWRQTGLLRPAGDGLWRLTPGAAWRHLRQIMKGQRRLAKRPAPAGEAPIAQRVAADLRAFRADEKFLRSGAFSRVAKVLFFAASAAVGALAFGIVLSWELVPILLAVLLFHELGHALAMRITGYRRLGVLVIPLLGAVAIGRKDDAGPWQRLFVLLAGPVPGLVLAVVCLRLAIPDPQQYPWLLQLGAVALGLNLFNLLPVVPLDGGQIVDTFLFSHLPRLRGAFAVASWLALIGLAAWVQSHVLLALAVVMAIGGPALMRRFALAARTGTVPAEQAPHAAFTALHQQPALARHRFQQRQSAVRGALPFIAGRRPRAWESAACLAIYLAAIALPLAALLQLDPVQGMVSDMLERPVQRPEMPMSDWDAQLARAATPDDRWQVLFDAGQWHEVVDEDSESALLRYRQALDLARGFPDDDLRLLDSRLAVLRVDDGSNPNPVAAYEELLPQLRALQGDDRRRLAEAIESLGWIDDEAPAAVRVARLHEAVGVRTALSDDDGYDLIADRHELALLLDDQGDRGAAEAELRANVTVTCDRDTDCSFETTTLAWLLIADQRSAEAEAILTRHIPKHGPIPLPAAQALAWARITQGHSGAARTVLEASLDALPSNADWPRLSLLLDLVHASSDDARLQAQWLEQARQGAASMAPEQRRAFGRHLCHSRETDSWEAAHDRARWDAWIQVMPSQPCPAPADACREETAERDAS